MIILRLQKMHKNVKTYPGMILSEAMYVREIDEPPVSEEICLNHVCMCKEIRDITENAETLQKKECLPGFIKGRKCLSKETYE